jgi:hypothetical protein
MKVADYKNLNAFLTVLFSFFKENGIVSSIEPVEDYDRLLERILECEFNYISYYPGMYCADFKLNKKIEEGEVYYFIFGNKKESASLLIDLGERNLSSFYNFSWSNEKHPPYLKDFADADGNIKIDSEVEGYEIEYLNEKDILSFEEFKKYLEEHNKQGQLNVIEVE